MRIKVLDNEIELPDFDPSKFSLKPVLILVAAVFGLAMLWGTAYTIAPEEAGVVIRLGAYQRTTQPGLHLKIPLLERVEKVPVQRQLRQEFGFQTEQTGVRSTFNPASFLDESLMLTGDLNVAVVEWIVQYRVADPFDFLFKVRNRDDTFRDMNEAVMRQIVGDRTVTEVLTVGRQDIEFNAQTALQALADQYEIGIRIEQVVLQDVNPPDAVKPSWDEVNQSQQESERMINEAQTAYNSVIPRAAGEAQQTILQAEGYALDRVNRSEGDAARFIAVHVEYQLAPEVTRQRMYLETMERMLGQVGAKIILDSDAQSIIPLLPLDGVQRAAGLAPAAGGN
jgi:membrane protease subunit HflK